MKFCLKICNIIIFSILLTGFPKLASGESFEERIVSILEHHLAGKLDAAERKILNLKKNGNLSSGQKDYASLALARILFEKGDFEGAIIAYNTLSKNTPLWVFASEEKAWALFRIGNVEQALSTLLPLITPKFRDYTSPETYLLLVVAQMRVCDYRAMFSTVDFFRKRYLPLLKEWEKSGDTKRIEKFHWVFNQIRGATSEGTRRMFFEEKTENFSQKPRRIRVSRNELIFPNPDPREGWSDETENYSVELKKCPGGEFFLNINDRKAKR